MRHLARLLLAFVLVTGPAAGAAWAASIEDLAKLKVAGVSDEVLIAFIESEGVVYHLTTGDVLLARGQGLSDNVIVAMLKTATRAQAAIQASAVPPRVVKAQPVVEVSQDTAESWAAQSTPVVAPVVVNVTQHVTQRVEQPQPQQTYSAPVVYVPIAVPVRPPTPPPPPVYWGWGGQQRPDSWQDKAPPTTTDKDPKTPPTKGGGGS
jgi:hypothetical protein